MLLATECFGGWRGKHLAGQSDQLIGRRRAAFHPINVDLAGIIGNFEEYSVSTDPAPPDIVFPLHLKYISAKRIRCHCGESYQDAVSVLVGNAV